MLRTSTSITVLAATALVTLAGVAGAAPADAGQHAAHHFRGPLTDLQPALAGPFDGASARLLMVEHGSASTFVLSVRGISPPTPGQTFGAHLHTGPCIPGNGAAAGSHYNASAAAGAVPALVSDQTEVWLDLTADADGNAVSVAQVPFVVPPGQRSIVLHAMPTDDHGTAGARQACLPVTWS